MDPFYNYLYDRQETPAVSHCNQCGCAIYEYDICYLQGSYILCTGCADEEAGRKMTGYELDEYFYDLYGGL